MKFKGKLSITSPFGYLGRFARFKVNQLDISFVLAFADD